MKKLITLFVATALCVCASNAQHYRGFVDVNLSIPTVKMDGGFLSYSDAQGFAIGLTTSPGVQIKNVFVGAGIGAFYNFGVGNSYPIPLFINGRYDFFNIHKANIFIDCKLGYLFNRTGEFYWDAADDYYYEYEGKWGGLFFNPSVGVRFRCSNTCGINIALGYMPMSIELGDALYGCGPTYEGDKFTDHRLSLTFGVDF